MRKIILTTVLMCLIGAIGFAQVGIGTATPNASSVLDLTSTTKAFLPPRMTTTQRDAIANPIAGMTIFNTTTTCLEFYNGSGWYNTCTGTTSSSTIPTITGISPSSTSVGSSITITGTNFTSPASVNFTGAGSAATATVVNATTITVTVPSGATTGNVTVTTAAGTSVGSSITITSGASSNSVATSDLIAHWTFDATTQEVLSSTTPSTNVGVTTNASGGQIGGYASFSNGYLVYPTIAAINSPSVLAAGYTFTTWAQFPTTTNLTSLWQINGNIGDIWATAGFTFRHYSNDSLDLDGTMTHVNGTGTHTTAADDFLQGTAANTKTATTAWAFIAMVYDTTGGSKKIKYYANGVLKGTMPIATTAIPAAEQFELICTSSFGGTGRNNVTFGTFNYSGSPAIFPSGGGGSASWQNTSLPSGTKIDDTRLFKRVLTPTEISQLYTYGSAGN